MQVLNSKSSFWDEDIYICTTDIDQKKKKIIKGEGGKDLELYIGSDKNRNNRVSHPNYGTIVTTSKDAEFKKGDGVLVTHFTFENEAREKNVLFKQDGTEYFKVDNFQLMFGVVDGELIPRKYKLLCEPVYDKFFETSLLLTSEYEGGRRDIVKVVRTWKGCDIYKEGEYLLIEKNGDYYFDWEDKEYISVDHYFGDVLMKVPNTGWRKKEVHTHSRDHHTLVNPMDIHRDNN